MNIGKFSVKRPVTVAMVTLVAILFGIVSFFRMPVDLMPEMELPILAVMATYDGAGPEEVEELVTEPLEDAMAGLSGIDSINSISASGMSVVILSFDYGTNLDAVTNDVRDKLETAKYMLPDDAQENVAVIKMDINSMPILMVSVSGDRSLDDVKKIVDDKIVPRLERIDGVAAATSMGGSEQQVQITIDPYKLSAYGLNAGSITSAIAAENVNSPGGYITQGSQKILVRTLGQYESIAELEDTELTLPTGGKVRLGDVADVKIGVSDVSSYVYMNGESVIAIGVQKESGGNTVNVDEDVRAAIAELNEELYEDIDIQVAYSSADNINQSVDTVIETIWMAIVIAMVIIFIFLGNIRSTVIIGTSIPISVISTFAVMYFLDYTLNMVTLSALMLSVGMVVDCAVVVLENIFRHRTMGKSKYQAAVEGTQEVLGAVVASTLTSVAVYLPFVFVGGLAAEMLIPFAMTICSALVVSLIVSVTVVPAMSSKLLVLQEYSESNKPKGVAKFQVWFDGKFNKLVEWYHNVLLASLNHKKTTMAVVTLALIASIMLVPFIGAELMPTQDTGMVNVSVELPSGTVLEETSVVALQVAEIAAELPEVDSIMNSIGGSGGMSISSSENTATLVLIMKPLAERDRSCEDIAYDLQQRVNMIPGATVTVTAGSSLSMSGGISLQVKGDNGEELESIANSIEAIMYQVEGAVNIENSVANQDEELNIIIDREKAAYYQISASTVYQTVAMALNDVTVSTYRGGAEELDIVLRYPDELNTSLEDLENLMVASNTGGQVPLREVASVEHGFGQKSITRENQSRVETVSCSVYGRDVNSVNQDIMAQVNQLPLPSGVTIEEGGDIENMQEVFGQLLLAIVMALCLVYMVMAAQFESLWQPLLIMASIPVMFIGVFLGLFVTNQTINMLSLLGVLMLEGIVVNNAIVLVDYINQLRAKGLCKREAIVEAGRTRLRPILVTALVAALGMLPMLLSNAEGSETFKPLAAAVIFGLMFSTVISLLVIPIIYEKMEAYPAKIRRKIMKNDTEEEHAAAMRALEEGCWHDWEELQAKLEAEQKKEEEPQQQNLF